MTANLLVAINNAFARALATSEYTTTIFMTQLTERSKKQKKKNRLKDCEAIFNWSLTAPLSASLIILSLSPLKKLIGKISN